MPKLDALPLVFADDDLRARSLLNEACDPKGPADADRPLRRAGRTGVAAGV